METLQITWFILIWVLLTGYAILDGFDLGVGVLHIFSGKKVRELNIKAVGPVWDGNEVWLLAGGGALFAAFPPVYATAFSNMYLALMIVLFGLIFRAVSFEFRHQIEGPRWARVWDFAFGFGSLIPAIIFGVAVGNVAQGLPIDANGQADVAFLALLNPYALFIGVVGLVMFIMHGAWFMTLKTDGDIQAKMAKTGSTFWIIFVLLLLSALCVSYFKINTLFDGILKKPTFWLFFLMLLGAIAYVPVAAKAQQYWRAFLASSAIITGSIGFVATALFPNWLPTTIADGMPLTYQNSSGTLTLQWMTGIAGVGVPIMLIYTTYIYRVFAGKVDLKTEGY